MCDKGVGRTVEVVGASTRSVEDAIRDGVARAHPARSYTITEVRARVLEGMVEDYRVGMRFSGCRC